jgi:predicted DNA-binding ribbon-helix-helix protein
LSGADELPSAIVKRSVTIAGHSTSISLEEPFWLGLTRIARLEAVSVAALLRRIDAKRSATAAKGNLSSAIRLFVLDWLAAKAGIDLASLHGPQGGGGAARPLSGAPALSGEGKGEPAPPEGAKTIGDGEGASAGPALGAGSA